MMSSVIAAFFHCVSGKNNSLHGQCREGSESWCRYQRAKAAGSPLKEIEQGLPNKIINQIKPTYLKLCNETLLKNVFMSKTEAYTDETLSRAHVFERHKWFSGGGDSVEDDGHDGHSSPFSKLPPCDNLRTGNTNKLNEAILLKIPFKDCKEQLPAPGNRSNERRYRKKDLATTEERKVGTGEKREGDEKSRGGEK
ncbi:uncharacterized protein LOC101238613 [Trichonephila clavipes]|nr:uncharacterized protein LOC101238613 [Trichonephila clavipes]